MSRALRAVNFRASLRISPAVDGGSTVTVSSGGTPLFSTTVDAIRKHNLIDLSVPIPDAPARVVDVSISGSFAHTNDERCSRYDPSSLFLIVEKGAAFSVQSDQNASNTIAGFLEYYGGDVAIVVSPDSPIELKRAAVRLAYMVEQLYRWRRASVTLRSAVDPHARNIVLGKFQTDLTVRDNVLSKGPNGVDLLTCQIDPLLITSSVDSSRSPAPDFRRASVSLADLGMAQNTQGGSNPAFSLLFNVRHVGELPIGCTLCFDRAHRASTATPRHR